METESGHTIVEARKMYTQQLTELLSPLLYQGLKSIFDTCKEGDNKHVLKTFQEKLCSIIKWNQDIIDNEYKRILDETECGWLDKLIEAVFISNVKVLSSVAMKNNNSINIKIPDTKNFIHKCYIECARYFYEDPSLIDDREINLSFPEIQKNIKRSNLAISNSIEKTIRELIPIQDILENYLNENTGDTSDAIVESEGIDPIAEAAGEDVGGSDEVDPLDDGVDGTLENNYDNGNGEGQEGAGDPFMENPSKEPELFVSDGANVNDTPVYSDLNNNYGAPERREYNDDNEDNEGSGGEEIKSIRLPNSQQHNHHQNQQHRQSQHQRSQRPVDDTPFFDRSDSD